MAPPLPRTLPTSTTATLSTSFHSQHQHYRRSPFHLLPSRSRPLPDYNHDRLLPLATPSVTMLLHPSSRPSVRQHGVSADFEDGSDDDDVSVEEERFYDAQERVGVASPEKGIGRDARKGRARFGREVMHVSVDEEYEEEGVERNVWVGDDEHEGSPTLGHAFDMQTLSRTPFRERALASGHKPNQCSLSSSPTHAFLTSLSSSYSLASLDIDAFLADEWFPPSSPRHDREGTPWPADADDDETEKRHEADLPRMVLESEFALPISPKLFSPRASLASPKGCRESAAATSSPALPWTEDEARPYLSPISASIAVSTPVALTRSLSHPSLVIPGTAGGGGYRCNPISPVARLHSQVFSPRSSRSASTATTATSFCGGGVGAAGTFRWSVSTNASTALTSSPTQSHGSCGFGERAAGEKVLPGQVLEEGREFSEESVEVKNEGDGNEEVEGVGLKFREKDGASTLTKTPLAIGALVSGALPILPEAEDMPEYTDTKGPPQFLDFIESNNVIPAASPSCFSSDLTHYSFHVHHPTLTSSASRTQDPNFPGLVFLRPHKSSPVLSRRDSQMSQSNSVYSLSTYLSGYIGPSLAGRSDARPSSVLSGRREDEGFAYRPTTPTYQNMSEKHLLPPFNFTGSRRGRRYSDTVSIKSIGEKHPSGKSTISTAPVTASSASLSFKTLKKVMRLRVGRSGKDKPIIKPILPVTPAMTSASADTAAKGQAEWSSPSRFELRRVESQGSSYIPSPTTPLQLHTTYSSPAVVSLSPYIDQPNSAVADSPPLASSPSPWIKGSVAHRSLRKARTLMQGNFSEWSALLQPEVPTRTSSKLRKGRSSFRLREVPPS